MAFFRYTAKDKSGSDVHGSVQASSPSAAQQSLSSAGFSSVSIQVDGLGSPVSPSQPVPSPIRSTPTPKPLVPVAPVPTVPERVKTRPGRPKDLYFLFTQLASFYGSGINPASALQELARRSPPRYQESLKVAARRVGEGGRLSEVLETYPYLYPPDVVGMVRAGEAAGFLPESSAAIAQHILHSHRLQRGLFYFLVMIPLMIGVAPLSWAVIQGSLKTIDIQDKAGGTLPPVATEQRQVLLAMLHSLPLVMVCALVPTLLLLAWNSMPARMLRHRVGLAVPVIGGRARAEAVMRLSWAMGMISRAGMSPQAALQLAAQSIPNLALREQLIAQAASMRENEPLSGPLRRTGIFPHEYVSVVETGEMTGDLPRALAEVAQISTSDFQVRDSRALFASRIFLYGMMALLTLLLTAIFYKGFYSGVVNRLLDSDSTIQAMR